MKLPAQLTFRDLEPTDAIEAYVRERTAKLDTFFDRITGCRVVIESPHRHQRHGHHYRVRIDLTVPGQELAVTRDPPEHKQNEDLYAAVDDAFDDAQRILQDYARKRRGDVKSAATPSRHGQVTKLFSHEGYGFITSEGEDVYFHKNSVLHGGFDRLRRGARVRFVAEEGREGPQASTVEIVDLEG
jgi:ribosomal subunit interface protein